MSEFWVTLPGLKAYTTEDGEAYIQGMGCDTGADFDIKVGRKERLSLACIQDMKQQIKSGSVFLGPSHWRSGPNGIVVAGQKIPVENIIKKPEWDESLGTVVDAYITPQGQLFPKIQLDMLNMDAVTLFNQITYRGKQLSLSWGGDTKAWHVEYEPDGTEVRVIDKIELWHFVPTKKPVVSRNMNYPLHAVAKSIPWADAEKVHVETFAQGAAYSDGYTVETILKSAWDELEGGVTDIALKSWFNRHGVQSESELDNGDFAWISNDGKVRKLPFKVHGKVYEDGWRAAWDAAHGSRGGMDFSGGPSKDQVLRKLLAAKPAGIEAAKSDDAESVVIDGQTVLKSECPDTYEMAVNLTTQTTGGFDMNEEQMKQLCAMMATTIKTALAPPPVDTTAETLKSIQAELVELKKENAALKSGDEALTADKVAEQIKTAVEAATTALKTEYDAKATSQQAEIDLKIKEGIEAGLKASMPGLKSRPGNDGGSTEPTDLHSRYEAAYKAVERRETNKDGSLKSLLDDFGPDVAQYARNIMNGIGKTAMGAFEHMQLDQNTPLQIAAKSRAGEAA